MREFVDRLDPLAIRATEFLPDLLAAVLVLAAFYVLFRMTRPSLSGLFRRAGLHATLIDLVVNKIYRVAVLTFGVVMAADQVGVNVGAALAGIGVAGVAIGFAAQDSLANVIAGFLIFLDRPFQVDQWVTVGDHYGRVNAITLRSTRIQTTRNTYVVIPNRTIIDTVLVNHSHHGSTRVDVPVGIAYKESIPRAREVLLRAVRGIQGVAVTPAPDVVVTELAASGVSIDVRVWIDEASVERATFHRVVEQSKLALDEAGIEIPYPHLQLFVEKVEDRVWQKALGVLGAPRDTRSGGEAGLG